MTINKRLKRLRHEAHEEFDSLWQNKIFNLTRNEAYNLLAGLMDMTSDETHFTRFSAFQCIAAKHRIRKWKRLAGWRGHMIYDDEF